jgi:hypothetical protein
MDLRQQPVTAARQGAPNRLLARPFRGVISAPFLPMHTDGAIDWSSFKTYMGWIADQRPAAIAVNMDAAEAPALNPEERVEVMRTASEVVAGRRIRASRKPNNIDLRDGPPLVAKWVAPPSRRIVRGRREENLIERFARLHQVQQAVTQRGPARLPWE